MPYFYSGLMYIGVPTINDYYELFGYSKVDYLITSFLNILANPKSPSLTFQFLSKNILVGLISLCIIFLE